MHGFCEMVFTFLRLPRTTAMRSAPALTLGGAKKTALFCYRERSRPQRMCMRTFYSWTLIYSRNYTPPFITEQVIRLGDTYHTTLQLSWTLYHSKYHILFMK